MRSRSTRMNTMVERTTDVRRYVEPDDARLYSALEAVIAFLLRRDARLAERPDAHQRFRIRLDPGLPRREVRRVPADRSRSAHGVSVG
jgi:hypothetical protein